MFLNTNPHNDFINGTKTIRVGINVPDGAVNLAYYANAKVNKKDNVSVSDSAISIIDHKIAEKWLTKNGLNTNEDTVFPPAMQYDDEDGYSGILKLREVTWKENIEAIGEEKTITKQYLKITDLNSIPSSVSNVEDGNTGVLSMVAMSTIPTSFKTNTDKIAVTKKFMETFSTPVDKPEYNFPTTMFDINEDGYSGKLLRVYGSERFVPNTPSSNITYTYNSNEVSKEIINANQPITSPTNKPIDGNYTEGVGGIEGQDSKLTIGGFVSTVYTDSYCEASKKYIWFGTKIPKNDTNKLNIYVTGKKSWHEDHRTINDNYTSNDVFEAIVEYKDKDNNWQEITRGQLAGWNNDINRWYCRKLTIEREILIKDLPNVGECVREFRVTKQSSPSTGNEVLSVGYQNGNYGYPSHMSNYGGYTKELQDNCATIIESNNGVEGQDGAFSWDGIHAIGGDLRADVDTLYCVKRRYIWLGDALHLTGEKAIEGDGEIGFLVVGYPKSDDDSRPADTPPTPSDLFKVNIAYKNPDTNVWVNIYENVEIGGWQDGGTPVYAKMFDSRPNTDTRSNASIKIKDLPYVCTNGVYLSHVREFKVEMVDNSNYCIDGFWVSYERKYNHATEIHDESSVEDFVIKATTYTTEETSNGGFADTKFTAKCEYMNEFSKDVDGVSTQTPTEWTVNATYKGMMNRSKKTYDGYAHYKGIVIKKNAIGNLNPEGNSEIIMYTNSDGYLEDNNGFSIIEDELFYVTNTFKDNTPLFYKYRLSYKIYDTNGPDDLGYYTGEDITLVNSIGRSVKGKYAIILNKIYDNIYEAIVYTDFIPTLSNPVYAIYNGYEKINKSESNIDIANMKYGIREKISVVAAMDCPEDFKVETINADFRTSKIKPVSSGTMPDFRALKTINYKVIAERIIAGKGVVTFESDIYTATVVNKEFAFENELKDFRQNACCVSPFENNIRLTPYEMIMKKNPEATLPILRNSQIRAVITSDNEDEFKMVIEPSGRSLIYCETFEDTGILNKNEPIAEGYRHNKILNIKGNYKCVDGIIYRAYGVKCRNIRKITVLPPRNEHALQDWYPVINFGHFSKVYKQLGMETKVTYSIPEFNSQNYGSFGRPYVDIKDEKLNHIGDKKLKTSLFPLYIKTNSDNNIINLEIFKNNIDGSKKYFSIESFDFINGIIETSEVFGESDALYCNYTYEEQGYVYRGYYESDTQEPIKIDLNPNMYHYYTDTKTVPYSKKQSMNLFGHTVYFFLRPTSELERFGTSDWKTLYSNKRCVYHQIDNHIPKELKDLSIGSVFVRHNTSLKSTLIIDTRTRGGGILESISDDLRQMLEPESNNYLDIGYLDGEAYNENGVIIVRLDKSILSSNGGRFTKEDVEDRILKWGAYGIVPIIEYIDVIDEEDMPDNTLEVNSNVVNQINITPNIDAFYKD